MSRFTNHLTYANVMSTLCLILLVGSGTAYAANTVFSTDIVDGEVKTLDIGANQVTTGRIAPGNVFGVDLANDAVNSSKVGANALTGADINESTLAGVNAGTVGGMSVKKVNWQVPAGTGRTVVLSLGKLQLHAECQSFGDYLDVNATTSEDNSIIALLATDAYSIDDADDIRDVEEGWSGDFDTGEDFLVDDAMRRGSEFAMAVRIDYSTPSGFVAHLDLYLENNSTEELDCALTGTAIYG